MNDMHKIYFIQSLRWPENLYVGISEDEKRRLMAHNKGKCFHTSKFAPWKIVYLEEVICKELAVARERQIKKRSRGKKEALINGHHETLRRISKKKFMK